MRGKDLYFLSRTYPLFEPLYRVSKRNNEKLILEKEYYQNKFQLKQSEQNFLKCQ